MALTANQLIAFPSNGRQSSGVVRRRVSMDASSQAWVSTGDQMQALGNCGELAFSGTSTFTLSAAPLMPDGMNGQVITAVNVGNFAQILQDQTASGLTTNIRIVDGPTFVIQAGECCRLICDLTLGAGASPAWTVLDKQQRAGLYLPTLFNVTNSSALTPFTFTWLQLGSSVLASGVITIDPVSTNAIVKVGISVPVAVNFTTATQISGMGICGAVSSAAGFVIADTTNDRAEFDFIASDVASQNYSVQFMYTVV